MSIEKTFNKAWYGKSKWTYIFYPLLPIVHRYVNKKRQQFLLQNRKSISVPIVIVGNITVGGTGKSPMVIALTKLLKERGLHVGIVSRGYGAKIDKTAHNQASLVTADSSADLYGDEPVMLAQKTQVPLAIASQRVKAVETLLAHYPLDVIISDDGMQHYALERDIEIVMLDLDRGAGNQKLLPIGPLREPIERIKQVDFVASITPKADVSQCKERLLSYFPFDTTKIENKTFIFSLVAESIVNVKTGEKKPLTWLKSIPEWYVMAGIGNPERFLETLKLNGLQNYQTRWFPDHYSYSAMDLPDNKYVIMTEKDAVKCRDLDLSHPNLWYLNIALDLPSMFSEAILKAITEAAQIKSKY
ncbi:tetraacyldisaccharide 4'-kinase [Marinomonas agarivorans]|nr:tetraacyldisaccharide 4'-kinase [Marinomonas agarivorans]